MTNNPGPWIFSTEHNRYYRVTIDEHGQSRYEWAPEAEAVQHTEVSPTQTSHEASRNSTRIDSVQPEPEMAPAADADTVDNIRFRGTPNLGWYDRLDPSYRVREKREAHEFFKTGRVFSMLWAESDSSRMSRVGTENTAVTVGRFGENVYSQIRRFIVVRVNRQKHFIYACAISTYGGQGAMKRGCNAAEHTIVHLQGTRPEWIPGEWERGMTKDPIMITPTNANEIMEPASRLRCGRIYSIEWNVKLKDIGMVAKHDRSKLVQYFSQEQNTGFDNDVDLSGSQTQYLQATGQGHYHHDAYYRQGQ